VLLDPTAEWAAAAAAVLEAGDVVLLKGSRGMRLERLAEFLDRGRDAAAGSAAGVG
jgi:UDP-N-acetylmuramyl pentapeptide synthase